MAAMYEMRDSEGKGKGLFAVRNIAQGNQVLQEDALFIISSKPIAFYIYRTFLAQSDRVKDRFSALTHPGRKEKLKLYGDSVEEANHGQEKIFDLVIKEAASVVTTFYNNCFELNDAEVLGVFEQASRINHSCDPNAERIWDSPTRRIIIRARKAIHAGDEITISYLRSLQYPLKKRQELLQEGYGFDCGCPLCSKETFEHAHSLDSGERLAVGNNGAYDEAQWTSDMELAASYGIDGFVLNIVSPFNDSVAGTQSSLAFQAANNLNDFKLFFSFDYLGGGIDDPWADSDVILVMSEYGPNGAYYHVDGKPMVSTFEGPSNSNINDWPTINSSISGGIYFVPDWTSLGPGGFSTNLVDGAFSWNMWPDGPNNITTSDSEAWISVLSPAGKSFMMGVSPWFYTDLPAYSKAWVWRGDDMWYSRWQEAIDVLPEFIEIVTWNDFGESHYVGPIFEAGIPPGADYVEGYSHQAWLETLPFQIAAYKHAYNAANPAPTVASGEDKVVFWYRDAPASAGSTNATGNDCPSAINTGGYQTCYPVSEILEDGVFAIVLSSEATSATITIGGGVPTEFGGLEAGINFISRPFGGDTGNVTVSVGSEITAEGPAIVAEPPDGVANFNAQVLCAGAC